MKRNVYRLVLPLLLTTMLFSCKQVDRLSDKFRQKGDEKMIEVSAIEVKKSMDVKAVAYIGKVQPLQSVRVTNQNSGQVKEILVKQGQHVKAGQVLAVLDSKLVNSTYEIAEATLKQAEDGYDRMMQVYKDGGVTSLKKMEVETQLAKAKASFQAAEDALEKCSIKAPYSGIVEEVYVENGVEIALLTPIVKLSNISSVEITFPVPENEISGVSIGEKAVIDVPALNASLHGHVTVKGISASAISHTYTCHLDPEDNEVQLLPGMVCKVYLQESKDGLIVIPMNSVMIDDGGHYVWAVREGVVVKKRVTLDGFSSEGVIISSGLQEGDQVVVEGRRKISSSMKVKVNLV